MVTDALPADRFGSRRTEPSKERQEQKKKSSNKKAPKEKGDTPEPQDNIKTEEL